MEFILKQRQLRLLEEVCAHFKVSPSKQTAIKKWIDEGSLQDHVLPTRTMNATRSKK
jgi:hypothetical protein